MPSQGPNSGSTFTDLAGGSTWANPGNAASSNNAYAVTTIGAFGGSSGALEAVGFGFSVPVGNTVNGILVEIESHTDTGINAQEVSIALRLSDVNVATPKSGGFPGTTDTYSSYGGPTDAWGRVWTAAEINDSTFGVVIGYGNDSGSDESVYVDHIRITVYHSTPPDPAPLGQIRKPMKVR